MMKDNTSQPKKSRRLDNFNEYIFAQLAKKVAEIEKSSGRKVLNFGPGNPDFPPLPEYLEKYKEFVSESGSSSYPGYGANKDFSSALISWYKNRFGVELENNELYPLL